jgi:hypothetical protein
MGVRIRRWHVLTGAWLGRAELLGVRDGYQRHVFTMDSAGNVIDRDLRLPGRVEELTADRGIDRGRVEVYEVLR